MKPKAIVTGLIATYPVAGVLWDYAQYVVGLQRLGFEVYYVEDSGLPSYHSEPAAYLEKSLRWFLPELEGRWHYRTPDNQTHSLTELQIAKVAGDCVLFLNVSGGCLMRDEYMVVPNKVLIDTDPGLNHFVNFPKWDAAPGWQGTHGFRGHDYFFTYAENLGKPLCNLPDFGLAWHATRPPVVMDLCNASSVSKHWTTVMSWQPFQHYTKNISYNGVSYGAKEMEFQKLVALPQHTSAALEVAVGGANAAVLEWQQMGWHVTDAAEISGDPKTYREYIQNSRGEFSVAKNVYVATQCGWFSCRSVCYLAAGLPVVVQDTGFTEFLPSGEGLIAFATIEDAARGIETVERDYARHQRAARELARTYFASDVVLRDLLTGIGL